MLKKFFALLAASTLLTQNIVFAANPFPIRLFFQSPQLGSFTVFDLANFTVEVTNEDGSKFDILDDKLIVGDGDSFLSAVLRNVDIDEEVHVRALNLDSPYVEIVDDGKKVLLTYSAKDLVENDVNTAKGLYRMDIVNLTPDRETEIRAQGDFLIATSVLVDTVNFQRKILKQGMELRFNLDSVEKQLTNITLGYAHPDIDPEGRDYLSPDAEIAIYDEDINLIATYSGGDIKWNYDGTYSYAVDGPGEYLLTVTNRLGENIQVEYTVEPKMIMDLVGAPNPVNRGQLISFNISFMDGLPIRLPVVSGSPFDEQGNVAWENFEVPELYKFLVYERAQELILKDTKYLYANNADGDVIFESLDVEVDTDELGLGTENEYVVQVILEYPEKSFILGQAEFAVNEVLPAEVQIGNDEVRPGVPVSVAVYAEDGNTPVDLIQGYRLVVYQGQYNGENHLLSSDDGAILEVAGAGNYQFVSPVQEGEYNLALYDEANDKILSGVVFDVALPQEAKEVFVFPGDDHVSGLAGEDELPLDDNLPIEDFLVRCVDVEIDYWAFGITNALLDEGIYPVVVEEGGYNCRSLREITRKEFTTWLLKAYRPEDYAQVSEMDPDDVHVPFPDLDINDPFTPYVVRAAELDIIHGHPDGTFRPDLQINRAEVLKILLRSSELFSGSDGELLDLQLNHPGKRPIDRFSDLDAGQWYYTYLYFGVVNNIIEGYGDGTARMEQGIIFSEAAKILYLAKQLQGVL